MKLNRANTMATEPDLATIVGDVLGDLAFLVTDDEPPQPSTDAVWMECRISYAGPGSGELHCWCPRDFAVQLAANLLGVEPDNPLVQSGIHDALCEFMNVVCGQFVTARHGTSPVFNLSIPTAVECLQMPRFEPDEGKSACALSVGGQPFYCKYEPKKG